jgi:hypothetical protein
MRSRRSLAVVVAVTAATIAVGARPAVAATIGGVTSAKLTALTLAASTGAPVVLAWENFTGSNGTSLGGTTTDGGSKAWSVNPLGGLWAVLSNAALITSANSSLVIDAGGSSDSVVATIYRNSATTFDAGLTVNRNSGGTQFLTVEWTNTSNGPVELWKYNSGSWTALATVTNLYPGGISTAPASITLKLTTSSAGVLTAYVNGVSTVTATLSAGDQTTYKNSTHQLFGLYQYTSNGLTFDNFHLDNP